MWNSRVRTFIAALLAVALPSAAWTFYAPPVVPDAVSLRVTDAGLNFVEKQLANRELHVGPQLIAADDVLCYDQVGIDQAVIDLLLEKVDLDFQGAGSSLKVVLSIPEISILGELYGADDDTFDLCPSFSAQIEEFRLTGVVFESNVSPWVDDDYVLQVDFVEPPQVYFDDIAVDLNNFSDTIEDLVFSTEFIQDFILDKVNEMLQEQLPVMLRETAMQAVFEGQAGGFDYFVGVGDIAIDDRGGNVDLDVGLSSVLPTAECIDTNPGATFEPSGDPGLGQHGDLSMLEMSVSDAILNEALYVAWRIGFMCYDDQQNQLAAFEALFDGLEAAPGEALTYDVAVKSPPRVSFKQDGQVFVEIKDFNMVAHSAVAGEEQRLLFAMEADMSAAAILTMDPATNQILLSIDALNVDFDRMESEVLFSDSPNAEEDLKNFVVGYVLPRMQNEFTDLPVSNSIIYAGDYALLFDFLDVIEGHAVAGMSIYNADDPNLDHEAPDTFFTYAPPQTVMATETSITFDGTDTGGGGGELVFSYKLDDAAWSPWKTEKVANLKALTDGAHTIQVKARDRFLNEDQSPAVSNFQVHAVDQVALPGQGCACSLTHEGSSGRTASASLLAAALLMALALRRSRETN